MTPPRTTLLPNLDLGFFLSRVSVFTGLVLVGQLLGSPVFAAEVDNVEGVNRIKRIEQLLDDVRAELDSLKRDPRSFGNGTVHPEPILGELLTDRQRILAKANLTEQRAIAAGYSFNKDLPMGMHVLRWWDPWGVKIEGGFIVTSETRIVGLGATGYYSINRFTALDLLETHLYAFGGTGYYWERVLWETHINQPWYETPNRWIRTQLGIGTELSFFEFGGIRLTPETGLQADRYIARFQDSPNYFGQGPASDFSLSPFFAFHISFYFR